MGFSLVSTRYSYALTHIIDNETFALSEDEPGRVGVKGDGQVRRGGGQFEGAAASDVASQDPSRDLIPISEGQHVAVTDVKSEDDESEEKGDTNL